VTNDDKILNGTLIFLLLMIVLIVVGMAVFVPLAFLLLLGMGGALVGISWLLGHFFGDWLERWL